MVSVVAFSTVIVMIFSTVEATTLVAVAVVAMVSVVGKHGGQVAVYGYPPGR
jgi:hypothetical protein